MGEHLRINRERLWQSLEELAKIGAYEDEATGLTGVNRQSLTDADAEARKLLTGWMEEAGLTVTVDEMGSIFGRREGLENDLPPVMFGSHFDTVATAGMFDGCLGVLGALEVIRSLNDQGIVTRRPLEVAAFTEEEGVRFGVSMLASAVSTGRLTREYAYDRTDLNGLRYGDELERIGAKGDRPPIAGNPPYAFVECHVEQGPILEHAGVPVGVVSGVQAISWHRVTLHGRAAHAGSTPTELRIDAGLAAAQIVVKLREMVNSGNYGQQRATVGRLQTYPGLPNVIPVRAEMTVDLRNPDEDALARMEADLAAFLETLPEIQPGLRVETERMAGTRQVPFDEHVQQIIATTAEELGYPTMSLMAGAGHDAQEMASLVPTAMIFVRGQYNGISHNPREYSTPEDCEAGINVLGNTVLKLSAE